MDLQQDNQKPRVRSPYSSKRRRKPKTTESIMKLARYAFEQKNYFSTWWAINQIDPKERDSNAQVQLLLGRTERRRGNFPEAQQAFQKAYELDPNDATIRGFFRRHASNNKQIPGVNINMNSRNTRSKNTSKRNNDTRNNDISKIYLALKYNGFQSAERQTYYLCQQDRGFNAKNLVVLGDVYRAWGKEKSNWNEHALVCYRAAADYNSYRESAGVNEAAEDAAYKFDTLRNKVGFPQTQEMNVIAQRLSQLSIQGLRPTVSKVSHFKHS